MKKQSLIAGAVFVLTVIGVAVINLAGAWYGGPADIGHLAATAVYVCAVTGFLILGRNDRIAGKAAFAWSLLSFISGVWSLLMRLLHSGFVISAFISVLSSVPLYGLRHWLDWTYTYAVAAGVSLVWLVWSGFFLRKQQ